MSKPLKYILFLFLLPVFAAVAIVGGLLVLLDPNAYKPEIAQWVEAQTGRHLTIREDFSLSLFPWVGVRLGAVELGNAPGFSPEAFARIASAHVRIKMMPLLQRRLEVDTITLQGVQVNLEKNSQGRTNWSGWPPSPSQGSPSAPRAGVSSPPPVKESAPWMTATLLEGVRVVDAQVVWRDATKNYARTVRVHELTLGSLRENQPVPLELRLQDDHGHTLHLQTQVIVRLADSALHMPEARFAFRVPGNAAPLDLEVTTHLLLDWQQERLQLDSLQLSGAGLRLRGQCELRSLFSAPQATGTVTVDPFSLRETSQQWGMALPASRDPGTWTHLAGTVAFAIQGDTLTLDPLQVRVDESRVNGQLSVAHFMTRPVLRWDLALDHLDLDRYRSEAARRPPALSAVDASSDGQASPAAPPAKTGPWEGWRAWDMQGHLRVGQLRGAGLLLQEVDLPLQGAEGVVRLTPVRAHLYQGSLNMDLQLDGQAAVPHARWDMRWSDVQLGDFLKDLRGDAPVSGWTTGELSVRTTGDTVDLGKKNLQGSARWRLRDGVIQGLDLPRLLEDAEALVQGESTALSLKEGETPFGSLDGSVTIRDGVLDNRDLLLRSPMLQARGAGTLALPTERVDYRLRLAVAETWQGKGGRTLRTLAEMTLPVQVTGTLSQPSWTLDVHAFLEQEVGRKAKEKLATKVQEKAMNVLKKQGLEKLLPADAGRRLLDALPVR
ncbi:MAG: AsmA family protein [Magnetococcales bacterium]|nr:AsmA family protein [Magnetococcales bacterium]